MTIKCILRYLLAALCFGTVGVKMANAQTSLCNTGDYLGNFHGILLEGGQASNIWSTSTDADGTLAYAYDSTPDLGSFVAGTYANYGPGATRLSIPPTELLIPTSPDPAVFFGFEIENTMGAFSVDAFDLITDLSYTREIIDQFGNPVALGETRTFQPIYVNFYFYDPTGTATNFSVDGVNIGITSGGVSYTEVCGVPEPSSSLLAAIGLGLLASRRKR